ncbi:TetR family transcriptional regulator [Aeromicrobium sp. 636]|uniref:TetR/AcrR family transcriptional regulator n=1 Tax=Aeromicrobium senzhongii TaxID=2663859 RepID=A0A8I0K1W5_9ACTN|nr:MULTISPECIES: TetR/AcrR family transcriptional regulator [Aeromicrobium]MBC9227453.1 TetR/AcrR family transcriptional regulator [Aeromicrobium senzhongii]MCQ3999550.1 TetR family transcriptional regulator [Aeromicrobium sp. 636]MTB88137.1 TetR family transcriptional regulator [Aeromicrobium senzhongii]QNL94870.1 TetR/AcrR family transcriptional regulator [Aeromicrobium senzhongii]
MSSTPESAARHRRSAGFSGEATSRDLPTTPRGLRTRAKLVDAARVVFERDGFLDARLVDITSEAGISAGSFYTYFDSKEEIFSAVLGEVEKEMLHPDVRAVTSGDDPVEMIRQANRAYLESYQRFASFMRLLEQVASIDEGFRELRRKRGESFVRRNAKSIRQMQQDGVAGADIDPMMAASFLSGMVARAAYSRFVLGEDWTIDQMVDSLTELWANALKITRPAT